MGPVSPRSPRLVRRRASGPAGRPGGRSDVRAIRELHAACVEIGSHTTSHRNLADVDYVCGGKADLLESRLELESMIGAPVTVAAYPYGPSVPDTRPPARGARVYDPLLEHATASTLRRARLAALGQYRRAHR